MTEEEKPTYMGKEQDDKWISDNAGVGIEWYVSEYPEYSGPILIIDAQGTTVEYPIPLEMYEDIDADFSDIR